MRQKAFKNFVLFKPRTQYACAGCGCAHKVYGDTWLECQKPIKAEDGTKAFRIFWTCHNGHKKFRGYSRPVNWKKNLGGDMTFDDGVSFSEEEEAIAREWAEMEAHAKMQKGMGIGKKYI